MNKSEMFLMSYFVLVRDHDSFAEIAKKDENIKGDINLNLTSNTAIHSKIKRRGLQKSDLLLYQILILFNKAAAH